MAHIGSRIFYVNFLTNMKMRKIVLLTLASALIGVFSGCLIAKQEIAFTTSVYSYLVPAVDTIDFTTKYETNAYISKVVCADEEALNSGGPSLMSSYAKSDTDAVNTVFNLPVDRLDKFDGQLCDVYVTAYDAATTEETEAVLRVNIGEMPDATVVPVETLCEDGTVCVEEEDADTTTEGDVVTEEGGVSADETVVTE